MKETSIPLQVLSLLETGLKDCANGVQRTEKLKQLVDLLQKEKTLSMDKEILVSVVGYHYEWTRKC